MLSDYRQPIYTVLFLIGLFLVLTSDLKMTAGILMMTISYSEFRNSSLTKRVFEEIQDALDGDDDADSSE